MTKSNPCKKIIEIYYWDEFLVQKRIQESFKIQTRVKIPPLKKISCLIDQDEKTPSRKDHPTQQYVKMPFGPKEKKVFRTKKSPADVATSPVKAQNIPKQKRAKYTESKKLSGRHFEKKQKSASTFLYYVKSQEPVRLSWTLWTLI